MRALVFSLLMITSMVGQDLGISEVRKEIEVKYGGPAADSFADFYKVLVSSIKSKDAMKLNQLVAFPFYVFEGKRRTVFKNKQQLGNIFSSRPKIKAVFDQFIQNQDDLVVFPHGVSWGEGALFFLPTQKKSGVSWKVGRIVIPSSSISKPENRP